MSSSKYGDLIKQARQSTSLPDSQISLKPDDQLAKEPDNQISLKPDNQLAKEPDNQISLKPASKAEAEVNLSIRVPVSLRRHWAAEAKRQGTTLTKVIVEALSDRFGIPPQ